MCKAPRFAPAPTKPSSFPIWSILLQNKYIWQGKKPGGKRQTSSRLGRSSLVKHTNTCLPSSTWLSQWTSWENQACLHQGLQKDYVWVLSCRQSFQLWFWFFSCLFVEKDTKQERACAFRVGEHRWQHYKAPLCYSHLKKTHTQVLLKGRTNSIQTPVLRLKEMFILCTLEQSEGRRSRVSWMLKSLFSLFTFQKR